MESDRRKPWQFGMRTLLWVPLIVALACVALRPSVILGRYCIFEIVELDIEADNVPRIHYRITCPNGTRVFAYGSRELDWRFGEFIARMEAVAPVNLDTDIEHRSIEDRRAKIKLEVGRPYEVRSGETLCIVDFVDINQKRHEFCVTVE